MKPDSTRRVFRYLTDDVPGAIAKARRNLHLIGWGQTKLIELTRTPDPTVGVGYEEIVLVMEGRGPRTASLGAGEWPNFEEWKRRKKMLRGMPVRTLTEGYNFAGGRRHTMPAGSVGTVVGRDGITVRVCFAEAPGHTFGYAPSALEVLP